MFFSRRRPRPNGRTQHSGGTFFRPMLETLEDRITPSSSSPVAVMNAGAGPSQTALVQAPANSNSVAILTPASSGASSQSSSTPAVSPQAALTNVQVTGTLTPSETITASATATQTVTVNLTVMNNGALASGGTVSVNLVDANNNVVSGVTSSPATVGANGTATATLTIPANTAPDTYGVQATYTDANGNMSAAQVVNTTNNGNATELTLTINDISTATMLTIGNVTSTSVGVSATVGSVSPSGSPTPSQGTVTFALLNNSGTQVTQQSAPVTNGSTGIVNIENVPSGQYSITATYVDSTGTYDTSTSASQSVGIGTPLSPPSPPSPPPGSPPAAPTPLQLFIDGVTLGIDLSMINGLATAQANTALIADIMAAQGGLFNPYLDAGFFFVANTNGGNS